MAPDVRVLNLETSVTRRGAFAPGKGIHYRMHPANLPAIQAWAPHVCGLANNHVLDFGVDGLLDTLDTLQGAGLQTVGAGRDSDEAQRVGIVRTDDHRVLVLAVGHPSSGIPVSWAVTPDRPGVYVVRDLTEDTATRLAREVEAVRQPGDIAVLSIHWGSNWGLDVPMEHQRFAHALVDHGIDIVHGHSSHHARPIEVYDGRLVLYGCGDFINDYEGISGYEQFRDDLRPLYLAEMHPGTGSLRTLRIALLKAQALRLQRASPDDVAWFASMLRSASAGFGTALEVDPTGLMVVDGPS